MLYVLIFIIILFTVTFIASGFDIFALLISILVILIILSFSSLTVFIDEENLNIKFGYGIYKKQFLLSEIMSAKTVKNHWYYGWGIRWWNNTWIYNVSGFDAIEIVMKNGKVYRIGTNDPIELEQKINLEIKH